MLDGKKVTALQGSVFSECTRLSEIVITCTELPEVGNFLLTGLGPTTKIKVPKDLYTNYLTDYFWGYYSDSLESY